MSAHSRNGNGQLILAVGYARRSTDKQEASIPDQRSAVDRYAAEKGYQILRWYIDDAISGDDTEKRLDFQRMIADARDKGDFKAILCWDQDRFGRFDSLEAGHWIYPVRRAGIMLVTLNEGPIDWNDFTGRLMYSIKQEGKHQFLLDLSNNVTRGHREAAKNGSWLGSVPYAYRIEGPKKQKRLVLDDPAKMRIVLRIFREYVDGRPMQNIANRLNAEGILSPGGGVWRFDTVKVILENPAYTGDYAGGRYRYGKYHTMQGKVIKGEGRCRAPKEEWIVHADHHESIIDRATFERAEAILAKGKGRRPHTPETNPYLLSGLLRCGKCGSTLHGIRGGGAKHRSYECGKRAYTKDACEGTTVQEGDILRSIAEHLDNWLGTSQDAIGAGAYYGALTADDLPEGFANAFAEIRKLLYSPAMPKQERKRLEKATEQVKAKLTKARANLALLGDPANIPAVEETIRQLDKERATLEQELRQSKPPKEEDMNAVVLEVMYNLVDLAYYCRSLAKPQAFDEGGNHLGVDNGDGTITIGSLESRAPKVLPLFLRRFLPDPSHIVCYTTKREGKVSKTRGATSTRHRFERAEIVLNGVGASKGNPNPHLLA